jgi:uncharacterized membrane protein
MVGLGDLSDGGFESRANAMSADGTVIVGQGLSGNGREAFIWTEAIGMVNLRAFLLSHGAVSVMDWVLTQGSAVSPDGLTVVGYGINPQGEQGDTEAWVATIPEPSTLALAMVAAVSLVSRVFCKRRPGRP